MILFTYLCSKICLLLNTPAPVGTTLRCRRNSRRFVAGVPEKKFPNRTMHGSWLIRDSKAGNLRKQLWLPIPKGISCRTQRDDESEYSFFFTDFLLQWKKPCVEFGH
jgi:hypothetical protein